MADRVSLTLPLHQPIATLLLHIRQQLQQPVPLLPARSRSSTTRSRPNSTMWSRSTIATRSQSTTTWCCVSSCVKGGVAASASRRCHCQTRQHSQSHSTNRHQRHHCQPLPLRHCALVVLYGEVYPAVSGFGPVWAGIPKFQVLIAKK